MVAHTVPCLRDSEYTVILSSDSPLHEASSYLFLKFHLKHRLFGGEVSPPRADKSGPRVYVLMAVLTFFVTQIIFI